MSNGHDGKKIKVLIVEDEQSLIDMYALKFDKEGYQVFKATDGLVGVEMAKKEKPDIILLDIIMPRLDGFGALKQLRDDAVTKNIPTILLTNLGQEEDVKRGKELGAVDYFIKANKTPSQVVDKVKQVLNK